MPSGPGALPFSSRLISSCTVSDVISQSENEWTAVRMCLVWVARHLGFAPKVF